MEDEKDAVDMADEDLEGELGSVDGAEDEEGGSQNGSEEDDNNNMDEEAGEVDDLDPTAVDEKMWDGDDEKAEKDQQGNKSAGQEQGDEQMAAEEMPEQKEAEQEAKDSKTEETQTGEEEQEEDDATAPEEVNRQDQNVEENDALELPEEMYLDFDDQASAPSESDDLDLLSDAEEREEDAEQPEQDDADEEMADAAAQQPEQESAERDDEGSEPEVDQNTAGEDELREDAEPEPEPEPNEQVEERPQTDPATSNDTAKPDTDNAAPSDVRSSGQDQNAESMETDEQFQAEATEQDGGKMGDSAADQETSAGQNGATRQSQEPQGQAERDVEADDAARSNPFRKLGDALEKWHRQQSDIQDAKSEDDTAQTDRKPEAEQGRQEFQHLQDDESGADTQAMGAAKDEEVLPVDESMAIEEDREDPSSRLMREEEERSQDGTGPDEMDTDDTTKNKETEAAEVADEDRSGVKTRQGNYNRAPSPEQGDVVETEETKDEALIEETSTQLSETRITDDQQPLRDFGECMRQWTEFQSKSHALSLSLTSQLRLILTPSQSTKLSGSFRTGKRLNIKRIIPYIASSYKRDKIWMRRSIPTKRRYQILLCVDDSKSMGESSSGRLAMESLVMVSRSLTMLEAGQVGVVGFGSDVFTAHELTEPFGGEAGAKVLQRFSFSQDRTDIAQLVRQTIDSFRAARRQQSGDGSDLWQLALILSDGLTPSSAHDAIRRLLREAVEERIMVVFIVMDDGGKRKGDSVVELKEAKFVRDEDGDSRVVIERYLDTFPFQYYLIVHNLDELPSALAGLLRTWFAEVAS
ncbi:hypothetical protein CDD83_601 [Cordyceps sp. RAO-2017]|nr:hypothetical protein CDD83_601 [Cordyceps sp. RAO-2017]